MTSRVVSSESRILRGLPVIVVGAFLDIIFSSEHGDSVTAFGRGTFRKLIWPRVNVGLSATHGEDNRTQIDSTLIKSSIDLMILLCKKVAPLFKDRDITSSSIVLSEVQRDFDSCRETGVVWRRDELHSVMKLVRNVSPTLYYEIVPQIWIRNENKPDTSVLEILVLDTLYLLRDIYFPIKIWQNQYWNSQLQDLMFELGVEKDLGAYNIDFVKVFILINTLHGTGLDAQNLETEVIANQLVGRMTTEGDFTTKRVRENIPNRYRRRLAVERGVKARPASKRVGRFAAP